MKMAVEPTLEQRARFQIIPQDPLALAQFVAIKDPAASEEYGLLPPPGGISSTR
jgi:hypothetical protein